MSYKNSSVYSVLKLLLVCNNWFISSYYECYFKSTLEIKLYDRISMKRHGIFVKTVKYDDRFPLSYIL